MLSVACVLDYAWPSLRFDDALRHTHVALCMAILGRKRSELYDFKYGHDKNKYGCDLIGFKMSEVVYSADLDFGNATDSM